MSSQSPQLQDVHHVFLQISLKLILSPSHISHLQHFSLTALFFKMDMKSWLCSCSRHLRERGVYKNSSNHIHIASQTESHLIESLLCDTHIFSITLDVGSLWDSVTTLRYLSELKESHIYLFQALRMIGRAFLLPKVTQNLYDGQYSYKRKFVKL